MHDLSLIKHRLLNEIGLERCLTYRWSDRVTGQRNLFGSVAAIGAAVVTKRCTSTKTMKEVANDADVCGDASLSLSRYCWFWAAAGPRITDRANPILQFPIPSAITKGEKTLL